MGKGKTTIEPLIEEHAFDTYRLRLNEKLWQFTHDDTNSQGDVSKEIESYSKMIADSSQRVFAIMYEGHCVGVVKLKHINCSGTGEVSYYLLRTDLAGTGITGKAVGQLLDYAFEECQLDCAYLYINPRNAASYVLAIKQGFYPVGIGLTNDNVQRLEITRTVWKNQKN